MEEPWPLQCRSGLLTWSQRTSPIGQASFLHQGIDLKLYSFNLNKLTTFYNLCKRTLKFLQAMAYGIWIVSTDWVDLSLQIGNLAHEESHEINGDTAIGQSNGPRLSRENVSHFFWYKAKFCKAPWSFIRSGPSTKLCRISDRRHIQPNDAENRSSRYRV